MQYEVENLNLDSLTRCYHGLYSEVLIQNNTYGNIVCIDSHNNKTVVPPMTSNQIGREQIVIWKRRTTNPTVENNYPKSCPGIRVIIPKHALMQEGGFFVKEVDLLVCTEAMSVMASHPQACMTYADAVSKATEDLVEAINDAPSIKITANDPEGRYNKLYTVYGNMTVEINVTKVYGECVLMIHYFNRGESQVFEVPLDEFFNSGEDILDLEDLPINFITTNRIKAQHYASEVKRIPQAEVDKMLKNAEQKAAKDIAAVKAQYETDITIKASENKRLTEELKSVNAEKDDLEAKYRELKGVVEANNVIRDRDTKNREYEAKQAISDNNRAISNNDVVTSRAKRDSAETEARFKLHHLVLAAAAPVAGQIALTIVKNYIADHAAKECMKHVMLKQGITKMLF